MQYADPYDVAGRWYKGNLHTHTTQSDGHLSPQEVVRWYEQNGYDFIAFTDHDTFTDPAPLQPTTRLALIPGFEYGLGPITGTHILCLGVRSAYGGGYQDALTATKALGGMAVFCHPNWMREDLWSPDAMSDLRGYTGMEIYNNVINRLPGRALATDDWDAMLTRGHLLWGYANQDAHRLDDFGHCFNMVLCSSLAIQSVLCALEKGHCYASTGLLFSDIGLRNGSLHVVLAGPARISFVGPAGEILQTCEDVQADYTLRGEQYVRVEAQGADGMAWSQPFWRVA